LLKEFLHDVPLFQDLDEDQLERLVKVAREEAHPHHTVLFREGDAVDAFYLVRAGSVTVFRDAKGKPLQVLARLEEGGFFGEMGLLNKARRIASARTLGPTVLVRIEKADLLDLLADNPNLELKFRAEVIRRHGMNVSSLLSLAGQRDVRIRLETEAEMALPDGSRHDVVLENLSLGGVGISGAPASWRLGDLVRFALGHRGEPPMLQVAGSVTWRQGNSVGIAFEPPIEDPALIHRLVRSFLDGRR
jgi:CRP-like cAMP-binding protein